VKYANIDDALIASNHFKNGLHILTVADQHGVENRILNSGQQCFGTFLGESDKMVLGPPDVKNGESAYTDSQKEKAQNNNTTDEAFKKQRPSC
jgi:hypothetical protein